MRKKYWTQAGITRLEAEIGELQERICLYGQTIANIRGERTNAFNDTGFADAGSVRQEGTLTAAKLTEKLLLLDSLLPMPAPTQMRTVQVGHLVRIRKEDKTVFAFILGGEGEVDAASEFPTFGSTAPLGMAVTGKSVGDSMEVRANDRAYEVEVISISVPEPKKLQARMPA